MKNWQPLSFYSGQPVNYSFATKRYWYFNKVLSISSDLYYYVYASEFFSYVKLVVFPWGFSNNFWMTASFPWRQVLLATCIIIIIITIFINPVNKSIILATSIIIFRVNQSIIRSLRNATGILIKSTSQFF